LGQPLTQTVVTSPPSKPISLCWIICQGVRRDPPTDDAKRRTFHQRNEPSSPLRGPPCPTPWLCRLGCLLCTLLCVIQPQDHGKRARSQCGLNSHPVKPIQAPDLDLHTSHNPTSHDQVLNGHPFPFLVATSFSGCRFNHDIFRVANGAVRQPLQGRPCTRTKHTRRERFIMSRPHAGPTSLLSTTPRSRPRGRLIPPALQKQCLRSRIPNQ
jgi:hypothetical protein